MDEFDDILNIVAPKIAEHPEFVNGFDLNLANWLDTTGALCNKYKAYKISPLQGMVQNPELQSRHLLNLWKHSVGSGNATLKEFRIAIVGKPFTAELIRVIVEHMGATGPLPGSSNKVQESEVRDEELFQLLHEYGLADLYENLKRAYVTTTVIWELDEHEIDQEIRLTSIQKKRYYKAKHDYETKRNETVSLSSIPSLHNETKNEMPISSSSEPSLHNETKKETTISLSSEPSSEDSLDVVVIVGRDWLDGKDTNNVEVVRIRNGKIEQSSIVLPPLPVPLSLLRGVFMNNRNEIMVSGAKQKFGRIKPYDECFILNIENKSWETTQMLMPRWDHATIMKNQVIFHIGGRIGESRTNNVEMWKNGSGQIVSPLPQKLDGSTFASIDRENFMVIGGRDEKGKAQKITYIYNMRHDKWRRGPDMLVKREYHSSAAIVDPRTKITTKIIVVGVFCWNYKIKKSTEICDIATNTWKKGPNLPNGIISDLRRIKLYLLSSYPVIFCYHFFH